MKPHRSPMLPPLRRGLPRPAVLLLLPALACSSVDEEPPKAEPARAAAEPEPTLAEERLAEAVAEITADTGSGVVNRMVSITRIESPAAAELFPGWEFTSLIFRLQVTDPDKTRGMSLPFHLGFTLAVAEDGTALRLHHYGNYEAFGDLLALGRITVVTDDDARRVWSTFCVLHGMDWPNEMARATPHEWHFGHYRSEETVSGTETSIEVLGRLYYSRLVTDAETGRVVSWKLVSEGGERRILPYDPATGGR